MNLRPATPDDIPGMLELGRRMIAEGSYSTFEYSPDRVAAFLVPLISHGFAWVGEADGGLMAVMLGDVVTPWFSQERMGVEYVLYLDQQHRSGMAAARLIGRWAQWCKDRGAVQLRPGVTTGNESANRLYERMGFERAGAVFFMNAR
ncbi:MAG: GNAT family N-acetyltransferase [Hydrogenophaga sp.]|nr:GNAT family N-acetyltransferase [Hydrogenophaga sp.]